MSDIAVIVVAHGSRQKIANDEVHQLSKALASRVPQYRLLTAFLDCEDEPTIPETIDRAVTMGAKRILILPYFLNSGNHVQKDIPAIIRQKNKEHTQVTIELTPHFGAHPQIIDLLESILEKGFY